MGLTSVFCEMCGHPSEFMSSKQVARFLGTTQKTIRKYIDDGRFPGTVKIKGHTSPWAYKIPITAVLPLAQELKDAGYAFPLK